MIASHKKYGAGTVLSTTGSKTKVAFATGTKTVKTSELKESK